MICNHCGTPEGGLHDFGCHLEQCPFCGQLLSTCECQAVYEYRQPHGFRSKVWRDHLEAKGRIPFLVYPRFCARCGVRDPLPYFLPPELDARLARRSKRILCQTCYTEVTQLIEEQNHVHLP